MKTLNQLARHYRQLCKAPARIDQQSRKLKEQLQQLSSQKQSLVAEIDRTKTLLDYCIVSGESPAQAALSHTTEQLQASLDTHRNVVGTHSGIYYDVAPNTLTISNSTSWTKPVSVTGAITTSGSIISSNGFATVELNTKQS